ncbi:MAG: ABC transporter substrate-binding protein [Magnetococcales bacterium]|nr:ABC transporter substrate-binding protein [Magnetococcales bacterium]
MKQRTRFFLGIIVFLFCTLAMTEWYWSQSQHSSTKQEKLIIAEAGQPLFVLVYLADTLGYFKSEGLEVSFKHFTSGRDALASAIKGESDIATVFETPVVLNAYQGVELGIISTLHFSINNTAVVALKERGISTPQDLIGKTLAAPLNTNAEYFLKLFLEKHGITQEQVTLINMKPQEAVSILEEGRADAIVVWNPHLYNAMEAFLEKGVMVFRSDMYTEFSVLAGLKKTIKERPQAMKKLLRAIIKAEDFFAKNQEEAQIIVMSRLKNIPQRTVLETWDSYKPIIYLNHLLRTTLIQEAEWFHQSGRFNTPPPDFNKVLFPDYLREVAPSLVTIQ